jgi:hypothetical protein
MEIKPMSKMTYVLTVALLLAGVPTISGHADDPKAVKALMIKKLENSQKVLEGLALGDFDKIAKHADELIQISKAAEFRVHKTPQYELYSNDFRRNAETLVLMAKAKNTDGAALAYVEMTLSCVKCHKHVREVRMTRLD